MPITRLQSKKMNYVTNNIVASSKTIHGIDFIDASKEWRKNKIKYDNCTFEYIKQ
jgi:hypothetical protein